MIGDDWRMCQQSPGGRRKTYDDEHCGSGKRLVIIKCKRQKAYIDPPAYAEASDKVCDKDGNKSVIDPVVGDTHVAEVVGKKHELVPQETKRHGTDKEPACAKGVKGKSGEKYITQKFWAIAREVRGIVETSVCDAFVELLVSESMLMLNLKREGRGRRGDRV